MSYDESDAARDAFYEEISRELYPEHKEQAIQEFTAERLRSFYLKNPAVMRPAVDAIQESKALLAAQRYAAAVVFSASAIELLLKATLLRPVVYGLVHHEALAEIIVDRVVVKRQTDIDRYEGLLAGLFEQLAQITLKQIQREGSNLPLLSEAKATQSKRDSILHQGAGASKQEAELAFSVAVAVFEKIVRQMLYALRLTVEERGTIQPFFADR